MRVGSIGYATDQGIAHLMKSFYDAGVVTDVAIFHHSSRTNHPEWYKPDDVFGTIARKPFDWPEIREWLKQHDAMLFFETPFDWTVIPWCQDNGIRTYIMPMYECTPRQIPYQPHRWLCPSVLDLDYFAKYDNAQFIEVPVEPVEWHQRSKALRFLHNGGNLGLRGHKGTLEIIQAMKYVTKPVELTIRSQDTAGLTKIIRQEPWIKSDKRVRFHPGEFKRSSLFDPAHDVFIMAEKYNGLSLPLREARAAGMYVMTSDRYPMNTWLPKEALIPVGSYHRACISGAYMEYDEARVSPQQIAAKIDEVYGRDISMYSRAGKIWADRMSWSTLKAEWLEALSK